jgi:hypothetical protein
MFLQNVGSTFTGLRGAISQKIEFFNDDDEDDDSWQGVLVYLTVTKFRLSLNGERGRTRREVHTGSSWS